MPNTCRTNEVHVPSYCRSRGGPRKASREKEQLAEYIRKNNVSKRESVQETIDGFLLSALIRAPSVVADVVKGMRRMRKDIKDVYKRYEKVIEGLEDEHGIFKDSVYLKHAVFEILLN